MKLLAIAILAFTLGIITQTVYAGCPSGYTSDSTTFTFEYKVEAPPASNIYVTFQCPVIVRYCCKWNYTLNKLEIIIDNFEGDNSGCLEAIPPSMWSSFIDTLHLITAASVTSPCIPALYPPCDELNINHYDVQISSKACVKIINRRAKNPKTIPQYTRIWEFCPGSAECATTYQICYDYSVTPPAIRRTKVFQSLIGIPDCQTEFPDIGEYTEEWETPCFALPCP